MTRLRITQVKSAIGHKGTQRRTITALGLGKLHRTVIHNDTPQMRGMVRAVQHLVTVEEVD